MSDALTLSDFWAAWELYALPALTGVIAGLVLGMIGVYVVLRRLVFLSAAVGQAASLGVAATFLLGGGAPTLGAIGTSCGAAWLVAGQRGRSGTWRDAVLGGIFLVGSAGTLAIGSRIVQELTDIDTLLFGSGVAVLPEDFRLVLGVFGGVFAIHIIAWRGFCAVSFDPVGSIVRRLPSRRLELALFVSLALAISVGTRVIGALPVFALSVLPAVAGARLASNVGGALCLGALLGALAGLYGYLMAFLYDLPVGASQTLAALAVALLAEGARRLAAFHAGRRPGPTAPPTPAGPHPARTWLTYGTGLAALAVVLAPLHSSDILTWCAVGVAMAGALPWALREANLTLGLLWLVAAMLAPIDAPLARPIIASGALVCLALSHRSHARRRWA